MIKKILCLIIVIVISLVCIGCSNRGNEEITDGRFIHIEQGWDDNGNPIHILVDNETNVMYLIKDRGITVMLDAEGKPLLWE